MGGVIILVGTVTSLLMKSYHGLKLRVIAVARTQLHIWYTFCHPMRMTLYGLLTLSLVAMFGLDYQIDLMRDNGNGKMDQPHHTLHGHQVTNFVKSHGFSAVIKILRHLKN